MGPFEFNVPMNICVFCASSPGTSPAFQGLTRALAGALLERGAGLVYGGASVGLMGLMADTVLAGEGSVTGVIPKALQEMEVAHRGLTELHVVPGMHERKRMMYDLSAGFIALPGGFGTFEEVFEATTWSQLDLHGGQGKKPVVLLDVGDYWRPLVDFLDTAVDAGFIKPQNRELISYTTDVVEAVELCRRSAV